MKKEPWRIFVFVIAVAYILFMWIKKDVGNTFASLGGDALPVLITSLAVTLVKVLLLTGGILLVKWLIGKIGGGK